MFELIVICNISISDIFPCSKLISKQIEYEIITSIIVKSGALDTEYKTFVEIINVILSNCKQNWRTMFWI
ncbi:MAG: hypothetical protein OEX98_05600 [Nitrosopumilus sp.]|nr:hypothetical protein [Nitrosopumilus sp.]